MTSSKYALITGASAGLGVDFAKGLAARGYSVILTARREERLNALAQEIESQYPVKAAVIPHDLSQTGSAQQLHEKVMALNVPVEVLINNAGFGMQGELVDHDLSRIQNMLQLNIASLTELTHLFGQVFKQQKSGYILQVASVGGFQPAPYFAPYAASKSYVLDFGLAVAEELKAHGVSVSVLCPGMTKTEFFDAMGKQPQASSEFLQMTSAQVAEIGLTGLFHKKRLITSGFLNKTNGVLMKLLPKSCSAWVAGQAMKRTFS